MIDYFPVAVEFLLSLEGGISSHLDDNGGLTKYGISQKSYPSLDIKNLTYEQAIAVYRRDFWESVGCGKLQWGFALGLFDAAVLHGPDTGIRLLQNALRVKVDGYLGPVTLRVANAASPIPTLADFAALRCVEFAKQSDSVVFGRGWFKRLFLVHAKSMVRPT